ncbi:response regulator [Vallitaleaceae bacterium 9-2]
MIIVDDEPLIVRGIERLVNWGKLGVEIVGTANCGEEALELIRNTGPDVVISDISMPDLSGIEVLKILNKENINTKIIFISGYQEFEYAREALKAGAFDYLVKPIDKQQLTEAVNKIAQDKQLTDFEISFLNDGEKLQSNGYYMFLNCKHDLDHTFSEEEKEIIYFSTYNIIEEITKKYAGHWVISKNNHIYVLTYHEEIMELEHVKNSLPTDIIESVREATTQLLSIGVSEVVEGINNVKFAYEMSNQVMEKEFFYGHGSVFYYKEEYTSKYKLEKLYELQENIAKEIIKFTKKKYLENCEYFINIIKEIALLDTKTIIHYYISTINFIEKDVIKKGIEIEGINLEELNKKLNAVHKFQELKNLMIQYFLKLYDKVNHYVEVKENQEILTVREYIKKHFRENILLETVANLVYMNPNYFSFYFKKQMGVNFKEYLTDIRMREAEKILMTTDKKIYEIAEYVGFNDYRHFSEVFRKTYGKLPSEYKQKQK